MRRILALSLLLSLGACTVPLGPVRQADQLVPPAADQVSNQVSITGRVSFPAGFAAQTEPETLRARATVSLLYPPDHPTQAHQTAAAGSTDALGRFSIAGSFTPAEGEWFILEASRRAGSGRIRQSLRTWVRRSGSGWASFSAPEVILSAETTALSALQQWHGLEPASLLASLDAAMQYAAPAAGPEPASLQAVAALVLELLTADQDPVSALGRQGGDYLPRRITNPQRELLLATGYCPDCDLSGAELAGRTLNLANLAGAKLRRADLRNSSLLGARLEGADLTGALLAGATWLNGESCEAGSVGACHFEQRINETTDSWQEDPQIASDAAGNYVVTWASMQDGDGYGIYARRYDARGQALGPEFQVNSFTTNTQHNPDVAVSADGSFLIVWQSSNDFPDSDGYGIYARRYSPNGQPAGMPFKVNTYDFASQYRPRVGVDAAGRYLVVWYDFLRGIFAQRLSSQGQHEGAEIAVNAVSHGQPQWPELAVGGHGGFVVSWEDFDSSRQGIYARAFDAQGQALSGDLAVNQQQADYQDAPSVGMDGEGRFVVAWQSRYQDEGGIDSIRGGTGTGIYARLYQSSGAPLGDEFRVNTTVSFQQDYPDVAMNQQGEFAIGWESWVPETPEANDILLQRYDRSGRPLGPETRVNSYTFSGQSLPALCLSSAGQLVAAWESWEQDGSTLGVYSKTLSLWP